MGTGNNGFLSVPNGLYIVIRDVRLWGTDPQHKWVISGRSPYGNGDHIYGENGWPMDFVSAMRFVNEQLEWFESLSEEEKESLLHKNEPQYDTHSDEPVFCMSSGLRDVYPDEELPFQ